MNMASEFNLMNFGFACNTTFQVFFKIPSKAEKFF